MAKTTKKLKPLPQTKYGKPVLKPNVPSKSNGAKVPEKCCGKQ